MRASPAPRSPSPRRCNKPELAKAIASPSPCAMCRNGPPRCSAVCSWAASRPYSMPGGLAPSSNLVSTIRAPRSRSSIASASSGCLSICTIVRRWSAFSSAARASMWRIRRSSSLNRLPATSIPGTCCRTGRCPTCRSTPTTMPRSFTPRVRRANPRAPSARIAMRAPGCWSGHIRWREASCGAASRYRRPIPMRRGRPVYWWFRCFTPRVATPR